MGRGVRLGGTEGGLRSSFGWNGAQRSVLRNVLAVFVMVLGW